LPQSITPPPRRAHASANAAGITNKIIPAYQPGLPPVAAAGARASQVAAPQVKKPRPVLRPR